MKAIKLFLLCAILLSAVIGWFCYFIARAEVNELKREKYRYTCTFEGCNKAFETKHELMRHRKHNHPTFICTQCEDGKVWFNTQKELDWHTDTQHGEYIAPKSVERETPTTYKCDYCGEEFSSRADRQDHMAKDCPKTPAGSEEESHGTEDSFRCEKCELSFTSQEGLDMHMRDIHLIEETPAETYECEICNKEYADEAGMIACKNKHPKCPVKVGGRVCGKQFKTKGLLISHMRIDHELFTCRICGTWFNSKEELKGHMKTKHRDER